MPMKILFTVYALVFGLPAISQQTLWDLANYSYLLLGIKDQKPVSRGSAIIVKAGDRLFVASNVHTVVNYDLKNQIFKEPNFDTVSLRFKNEKGDTLFYAFSNMDAKKKITAEHSVDLDFVTMEVTGVLSSKNLYCIDIDSIANTDNVVPDDRRLYAFGFSRERFPEYTVYKTVRPFNFPLEFLGWTNLDHIVCKGDTQPGMSGGPVFGRQGNKTLLFGMNALARVPVLGSIDNSIIISGAAIKRNILNLLKSKPAVADR